MKLPMECTEHFLEIGKGCTFFGHPVTELDKDDLIAAIGCATEIYKSAEERHEQSMGMFVDIERAIRRLPPKGCGMP